jgi:AraC-like DNA-binding protein
LLSEEMMRDEPAGRPCWTGCSTCAPLNTLRSWFEPVPTHRPRWYEAQADAVVGPALSLLHDQPPHPWTVAEIADRVGVSRAALARRFHDLVAKPPMAYLSQ